MHILSRFLHIMILLALLFSAGSWQTPAAAATAEAAQPGQYAAGDAPTSTPEAANLPAEAQIAISDTIGRDDPAYAILPNGDNYTASSPSQYLQTRFMPDAVLLEMDDILWNMHLRVWGRGQALSTPGQPRRLADANRIEYRYNGMTEWYVNGPMGLQQGFTLTHPPAATGNEPLAFVLGLDGLSAQLDTDKKGVTLYSKDTGSSLRYAGLRAFDAAGTPLPAWIEITLPETGDQQIQLRVDDRDAQYPVTVDPFTRQLRLTASDAPGDAFGFSVALNNTGDLAIIGAYGADVKQNVDQGAAYIFKANHYTWVMQAKLFAADGEAADRFGISVAMSGDGTTALIGANQANVNSKDDQGSAYIFVSTGNGWEQQARLSATDGAANDYMGWSVALNEDGNTALVSAHGAAVVGHEGAGSAYVFQRSGTSWAQQARLFLTGGIFATEQPYLGYSVALSADGNTALLGAYRADAGSNIDQGLAFTFTRNGTGWNYEDTLIPSDGQASDYFGRSVSLSADGNMALIGASGATVNDKNNQGAAYIFTRPSHTWSQQSKLTANDGAADDYFGVSVDLLDNGYAAYVGAYKADINGQTDQGAVYIFARVSSSNTTDWMQSAKKTEYFGADHDQYGVSVAIGGTTLLIGANLTDLNGNTDQGAAYTIVPYRGSSLDVRITGTGSALDSFGQSVSVSDDGSTLIVGANHVAVDGHPLQGAAYIFARDEYGSYVQEDRLVASDGDTGDLFGSSVAISADGNTALVGAPLSGTSNFGAAYVFIRTGSTWSQQKKLISDEPAASDYYGMSVSLSDDGNTALIGAYMADVMGKADAGMASVYSRTGVTWNLVGTMYGAAAGDNFGYAVSISGDGKTALIGASSATVSGMANRGAAYAYILSNQEWVPQGVPISHSGTSAESGFGNAVALSDDGNTALIGAYNTTENGQASQGIAAIYKRTSNIWGVRYMLSYTMSGEGAGDWFGYSVALSGDGRTALVGAPMADIIPSTNMGKLYLYRINGQTWSLSQTITEGYGVSGQRLGTSSTLSDDAQVMMAGADGDEIGQNKGQGSVFIYLFDNQVYMPMVTKQ